VCKLCGSSPAVRKTRTIAPSPATPVTHSTPSHSTPSQSLRPAKRSALIVANTYSRSDPLPGCKTSAQKVKQAFESRGIVCQLEIDVSAQNLIKMVDEFTVKNADCEARLFYFSGHGGSSTFIFSYCIEKGFVDFILPREVDQL
jgi:hypothetical protein